MMKHTRQQRLDALQHYADNRAAIAKLEALNQELLEVILDETTHAVETPRRRYQQPKKIGRPRKNNNTIKTKIENFARGAGKFTTTEMRQLIKAPNSTVYRAIDEMISEGRLQRVDKGIYLFLKEANDHAA